MWVSVPAQSNVTSLGELTGERGGSAVGGRGDQVPDTDPAHPERMDGWPAPRGEHHVEEDRAGGCQLGGSRSSPRRVTRVPPQETSMRESLARRERIH